MAQTSVCVWSLYIFLSKCFGDYLVQIGEDDKSVIADDHLTHGVHDVAAIWVRPPAGLKGNAVLIEAIDGVKTLLELSRPEDYALPPAKT